MTAIWVLVQFFSNPLKNIGKENFSIEHIFFAFSYDDLIWAEKHFVDLNCVVSRNTYNVELGGINGFHEGNTPHNKGKRGLYSQTEETKLKMSAAHKGKPKSKEASIKSGLSRRGAKRTPEQIKRLSDAHKGYKWSEERKYHTPKPNRVVLSLNLIAIRYLLPLLIVLDALVCFVIKNCRSIIYNTI